jgi:hypothetical protein
MLLLLLLLLLGVVNSTPVIFINNRPIDFSHKHTGRYLEDVKLSVIFRNVSQIQPTDPGVLLVLNKQTFVVNLADYITQADDVITPYFPEYKYREKTHFPIQVKCIPNTASFPNGKLIGRDLFVIHSNITSIPNIAQNDRVLWIDAFRPVKLFSRGARGVHLNHTSSLPDGSGVKIAVSDTGFDCSHCTLYDPAAIDSPCDQNSLTESQHSKVGSMITAIPGLTDNRGVNGAHGHATASAAAGYDCGVAVGMATGAKLWLYDFSPAGTDEVIYLPTSGYTYDQYREDVISQAGVTVISQSWGAYTSGRYDTGASQGDTIAYNNPYACLVSASGNGGGTSEPQPVSPSVGKDVISVGAVYTSPYTRIAEFTSIGPLPISGRENPLVYSPGVLEEVAYGFHDPDAGHNHYTKMSGTSFSTPNIAGLIARYQHHYKLYHNGNKATCPLVLSALIGASVPVLRGLGVPIFSYVGSVQEQGRLVTSQNTAVYCYRATQTINETIRMVMSFWDYPSSSYSSVNLINNLQMQVYFDYHLVFDGRDNKNVFELFSTNQTIVQGTNVRVKIYEQDGTIMGHTDYGFYIHSPSFVTTGSGCGTCNSADQQTCNEGVQYCNATSGLYTTCLPIINDDYIGVPKTCTSESHDGVMVEGEGCIPAVCHSGYYFDAIGVKCRCIPGFMQGTKICDDHDQFLSIATVPTPAPTPPTIQSHSEILAPGLIIYIFIFAEVFF